MKDSFLKKARSGESSRGIWLSLGSPIAAELAVECGFDWVLLDMEHGCGTENDLRQCLQAMKGGGTAGIVRVGDQRPDLVLRALDWGADGIMFPHVSTVQEAEHCVRQVNYPPLGTRGYSRSVRAYGYGLRAPENPLSVSPWVVVQIETAEAVKNAAEIAGVPGVDVLFVGPVDLQLDLTARGEESGGFQQCLVEVAAAAHSTGISSGILAREENGLDELGRMGYVHLALHSDLSILRAGFQRTLEALSGIPKHLNQ